MRPLFTTFLCGFVFLGVLSVDLSGSGILRDFGSSLDPKASRIDFRVPQSVFRQLPKDMILYNAQSPAPVAKEAVEWVIENAGIQANEKEASRRRITADPSVLKEGRIFLVRDERKHLVVSPDAGVIAFRMEMPEDIEARVRQITPQEREEFLDFQVYTDCLKVLISKLGFDPSEVARRPDGRLQMTVGDTERFPDRSLDPLLVDRSVRFSRQVSGYPLISAFFHEIRFTRLATGEWREIVVFWPKLQERERVPVPRSNDELREALARGHMFWDYGNQPGPEQPERIIVTGLRLAYMQPREDMRLIPTLLLDADLQGPQETDYALIFLPLLPSRNTSAN